MKFETGPEHRGQGETEEWDRPFRCWLAPSGASQVKSETGPCSRRWGRNRRKRQQRQVGGELNKLGHYIRGLSWAAARAVHLRTCPPESWVFIEALTGFSHIFCPEDLSNTLLSQGCILENGSHCGNGRQKFIPRTGTGRGAFHCPGPVHRSTGSHVLLLTSSHTMEHKTIVRREVAFNKRAAWLPATCCLVINSLALSH